MKKQIKGEVKALSTDSFMKPVRDGKKDSSRFELYPKWQEAKAIIDAGLSQKRGVQILVPLSDIEQYNLPKPRSVINFLSNYVASIGHPEYEVMYVTHPNGSMLVYQIGNFPDKVSKKLRA